MPVVTSQPASQLLCKPGSSPLLRERKLRMGVDRLVKFVQMRVELVDLSAKVAVHFGSDERIGGLPHDGNGQ